MLEPRRSGGASTGAGRRAGTSGGSRSPIAIAIVEGILIVVDELSKALALIVAIAVVVGFFTVADRLRPERAREVAWIAAVSQAIVMLVPVLVIVIGTLTIVAIAVIGVIALVLLFSRRG